MMERAELKTWELAPNLPAQEVHNPLLASEAMSKAGDIFGLPEKFIHFTTISELSRILELGLISQRFAERKGETDYTSTSDPRFVFFFKIDEEFRIGWAKCFSWSRTEDELIGIIADPTLHLKSGIVTAWGLEYRDRYRTAPRNFLGILVCPYFLVPSMNDWKDWKRIRLADDWIKQRVEDFVDIQSQAYGEKAELALPIYTVDGDLIWPQRITYEELRGCLGGYKT